MAQRSAKATLEEILRDPARKFRDPADVIHDTAFSRGDRLKILRQWEHDARGLAVAEEEGMGGGEDSLLSRVRRAIASLSEEQSAGSATKHG
jgi:hypothetical protein